MDCVDHEFGKKGMNTEMTADKGKWKKNTTCADPT